MTEDPYKLLKQSIERLETPLKETLAKHDEFVLQNVSILNNLASKLTVLRQINASHSETTTKPSVPPPQTS
jgi:hypothetical protein